MTEKEQAENKPFSLKTLWGNPYAQLTLYLLLFVLAVIGFGSSYPYFSANPFQKINLSNTSSVTADGEGNIYIIHNSNHEISKIKDLNQIQYSLEGGRKGEGYFYVAEDLSASQTGELAVLSEVWDQTGSYIENEEILTFDRQGHYQETVFTSHDESQTKLISAIKGLHYQNDLLSWYLLTEKEIIYYTEKQKEPLYRIAFESANLLVQDVEFLSDESAIVLSKKGSIFEMNGNGQVKVLYSIETGSENSHNSLWNIQRTQDGRLFVNDIGQFAIFELKNSQLVKVMSDPVSQSNQQQVFYYFHVLEWPSEAINHEVGLVAVNDNQVVLMNKDGSYKLLGDLSPSYSLYAMRFLSLFSLLALLIATVLLVLWFIRVFLRTKSNLKMGITVPILAVVALSSVLVSSVAIQAYDAVVSRQAVNNLKMVVQNSKFAVDGDAVEAIQKPSDFMNSDYQKVSKDIQALINFNQEEWNENLYTALYTVVDGRYYTIMYNDNRVTPYYPFNAWTSESEYDYFKLAYEGHITEGTEVDADGQWLFSMGPVYNSKGEVVAIIEVGMNKFIFDQWNEAIVKRIIIDIVSIIIILILSVSEVGFFSGWLTERQMRSEGFNELKIIRPLGLLTYMVIFMCTAFIPTMAKSIYEPLGPLTMPMALGLPIFTEVFFAAITIVFAGFLAEKRGWRLIFHLGIGILIVTAVATALTKSLIIFIAIRGLAGIGNGFIQMTMHAFINTGDSVAKRNEAFAHMMSGAIAGTNLGIVLGANLADKIGYFNVFYVMAFIGLLAVIFERVLMKRYETMEFTLLEEDEPDGEGTMVEGVTEKEVYEEEISMPWWQYFANKNVLVFFGFILVPAFLCYMYLEYFFPIFAEKNGLSTSTVGIVFSLYGLFIVYLGPSMSTLSEKYLGVKVASMLASVLTGLSLLVFALTGSLAGAVVAVLILALSDSFGETVYTTYFLALRESQRIGKSVAAGYLEFFSQIGKMIGALAFGVAVGFGEQLGIGVIGLVTLIMGVLFLPFGGKVK